MLHFCMSWMPAASIRTRAAHTSRMPVPSEHREWTNLSRSYRVGSDLVGEKSSPGSVRLSSRRKIPVSPFSSNFAHRLGAHRADARAHSRHRKWAYFAQFWCNLSPLDATLLSPLLCVAFKGLAQDLSSLDATLTKNIGGWGSRTSQALSHPAWGYSSILTSLPRYLLTSVHLLRRHPFGRKLNHAVAGQNPAQLRPRSRGSPPRRPLRGIAREAPQEPPLRRSLDGPPRLRNCLRTSPRPAPQLRRALSLPSSRSGAHPR